MTADLDMLLGQLRAADQNVRVRTALELGKLGNPATVANLVAALCTDPDFFVRETLVWALVRLRRDAVPPLIGRLSDPTALARMSAAHALGKIGDPRAVEPLMGTLADSDPEVVVRAIFALGQIGDARAATALVGLLGLDNRELEAALLSALERFPTAAVPPLIEALRHENWRTREQAADALRVIGAREAASALSALLRDPCWRVRFSALSALGQFGDAAGPDLLAMEPDPDARVRALQSRLARRTQGDGAPDPRDKPEGDGKHGETS